MGLLDALKQYLSDAAPGGLLNQEWTPENVRNAGEAMSMIPNPAGDIASGLLAADDLRKGNHGDAALNGLGLLPFVPAMGGAIKQVKAKNGKLYEIVDTEFDVQDKKKYFIRPVSDGASMKEGFLSVYKDSNGHHLNDVVIEKPWDRGNGLGSLLMEEALRNTDGKGLWGSTGFSEDGLNLANKFGLTKKDGKHWIPAIQ